MPRPICLFTGQWADLPLEVLAKKAKDFGYDGLELACWGDHFDVARCNQDKDWAKKHWAVLQDHGLGCFALSTHLVGQAVCDRIDERHKAILPAQIWGDGKSEGVQQRAAREVIETGKAARKFFDAAPAAVKERPDSGCARRRRAYSPGRSVSARSATSARLVSTPTASESGTTTPSTSARTAP